MSRLLIAELILMAGWALVLVSLWWVFRPAALLFCGVSLILIGLGEAKRSGVVSK